MKKELYSQTRNEIRTHARVRDQMLMVYLVAIGFIAAQSGSAAAGTAPLAFVPFIALGTSMIFAQRELYIALAMKYSTELAAAMNKSEETDELPSWDHLEEVKELRAYLFPIRTAAYALIVILPSVLSLLVGFPSDFSRAFHLVAWAAGIPITFLTLVVFAATFLLRKYWLEESFADSSK